jgi:hypothetical protein
LPLVVAAGCSFRLNLPFPSSHRCPLTSRWFGFARAPIWVPLSSMLASAASTAYCGSG